MSMRIDVVTGVKISRSVQVTAQGLQFEGCTTGLDSSGGAHGLINLIDSKATNTSVMLSVAASDSAWGAVVVENVVVDGSVGSVRVFRPLPRN